MQMKHLLLLASLLTCMGAGAQQATFRNPVIAGDMADPTVIRVDNTYYATGTSSEWAPYYPLFRSKDLVNWRQIGHLFEQQPAWTRSSFWAPELFHRNGKTYAYYTARRKTDGTSYIGVATADKPEGPYTDHGPIVEYGTEAIDAFVLEDAGELYISWKAYRLDPRPIELLACKISDDGLRMAGEPFTLLRDDIMDNAAVRRGKPSVYAKWGQNVAILSGDAMLICAYRLLGEVPAQLLPQILSTFNTMALEVCEGQQYDMDFERKPKVSVVEYMHMIELKTSVLLAGATTIGALLGGASEEDCRKLRRFAIELGLAFQLQDDLLDSYGDERLGKAIGGDILEGKQTYLMITAISRADEPTREVLRSTHRSQMPDAEKIATIKAVYDRLDIPRLTEQQISLRFERALGILDTLSVEKSRTERMREYALSLMGRKN